MMKFAHMADCHIGSWRDPKLKDVSVEAFIKSIDICINEKVNFVLIAGDLFNTALPGIDSIKVAVKEFQKLKKKNIPVYLIPGSHDYSPSGKTMIDVLEEAGLLINVVKGSVEDNKLKLKFTIDEKSGAKITGILGRRGSLDKQYYESLDLNHLEGEKGFKIFMFHCSIREMMPGDFGQMDSMDISSLPKGFDYYAGGHVHIIKEHSFPGHKNVVYPGPLFPASFPELEKLSSGGLFIYEDGKIRREELHIKNTFLIDIDCEHKSPEEATQAIIEKIKNKEFLNTIVLIKIGGKLKTGKLSDIKFKEIFDSIYEKGAFFVMRNTSRVVSSEYEEIKIEERNADEVEDKIIREHLGQIKVSGMNSDKELRLTKELFDALSSEKHEGEKVYEYEDRVKKEIDKILEI